MDRHIEMMMAMEKALIQAKCIVQPSIYIMPEVDKGIVGKFHILTALIAVNLLGLQLICNQFTGKLKEIVKRHQGLVTDNELEATHLLHQAADPLDEEYARPVFRRDKTVLMHW